MQKQRMKDKPDAGQVSLTCLDSTGYTHTHTHTSIYLSSLWLPNVL